MKEWVFGTILFTAATVVWVAVPLHRGLFDRIDEQPLIRAERGFAFSWESTIPARTLFWRACPDRGDPRFECARLQVPWNYSDPEGRTLAIALMRIPALVPPTHPDYKGPVLVNPGGPGVSGVDFVVRYGAHISTILGPGFDVVGFDPRGVGLSTPYLSFFPTAVQRQEMRSSLSLAVNFSDEGVSRTYALAILLAKLAEKSDIHEGYIPHINSPNTARDMLEIVRAHGREKLRYWGFSYGTTLGASFAIMFPDKVERLVLDGISEMEDYYGYLLRADYIDTDKALDFFCSTCFDAGPDMCPIYLPSPEHIKTRLLNLLQEVHARPVPVIVKGNYGIADYNLVKTSLFLSLLNPYSFFPSISHALADLAAGDARAMFAFRPPAPTPRCSETCGPRVERVANEVDSLTAILCNDAATIPGGLAAAERFYGDTSQLSVFADVRAWLGIMCLGWAKSDPGPALKGPYAAKTSFPILLVGNTLDPVTPLASARKMAEGFNDSVVLTQDSAGHTSFSAPSPCTQKAIRKYFNEGVLPDPGTVCKPLGTPFFPPTKLRMRSAAGNTPTGVEDAFESEGSGVQAVQGGESAVGEDEGDVDLVNAAIALAMTEGSISGLSTLPLPWGFW